MAEHPEYAKYSTLQGEEFQLILGGEETLPLTLAEVTTAGPKTTEDAANAGLPAPFSLLFKGPAKPLLGQAVYRLSHDKLGEFELFLVPVGSGNELLGYESVFS